VKDVPGFYVNRSLGPYMDETSALIRDGVDPIQLDKAIKQFGFPMGPITLADQVGIDVGYKVQHYLTEHLGVRMQGGDTKFLKKLVDEKILGKKSGAGFFVYASENEKKKSFLEKTMAAFSKKKEKEINPRVIKLLEESRPSGWSPKTLTNEQIQDRMVLRLVNEAVFCLQDEIISNPVDGDIGLIFGLGFPPFFGGPFRYVDTVGANKIVEKMLRLRDQVGEHFTPAPLLQDMAKSGKKFHSK